MIITLVNPGPAWEVILVRASGIPAKATVGDLPGAWINASLIISAVMPVINLKLYNYFVFLN